MRRSISSSAPWCAALALVAAFAFVPRPASADDRAAVDRGRTAGRGILIMRDPRVCGIALLHARCVSDATVFLHGRKDADFTSVPKIGPRPATGLMAFVEDGDRDAFDFALSWYNNTQSNEAMWSADARDAALYDAGIEDVFLPAARGGPLMERLGMAPVGDLANHAAQIPGGALPVDLAPIRAGARGPQGVMRLPPGGPQFAHDLVRALDAATPPLPFATLVYDGPAGDAALGVAGATIAEFNDSPFWLAQADVQLFIDAYVARLAALAPQRAAEIADLRAKLRGDAAWAHDAAQAAETKVLTAIITASPARGRRIAFATAATQIPYNAAILRDPAAAAGLLRAVGTAAVLDDIPGFASARPEAANLAANDWRGQYRLGLRLVDLLSKGGTP
jgi:hypothetical protein